MIRNGRRCSGDPVDPQIELLPVGRPRPYAGAMGPKMLMNPVVAMRRLMIMPPGVRRMDARAADSINRLHHRRWLDRGIAQLSRSADRSMLWAVIAIALYGSGGSPRRGAVRGFASLILSSIVANLIGKNVFGGDRPLLKNVPIGRQLKKTPTSPSFPSGHTASAVAFATGVALESGPSGAAIAPLSAAVAYSRMHTGAHWLSDVLGGAALGAAVAVVGRMLLPAPSLVKDVAKAPAVPLPALGDGAGAFIIVNPSSGIDPRRPDPVRELGQALPGAVIHPLQGGDDIATLVRDVVASADPPRVLGICGGDGSVAAVADAARHAGLPLLVLPGGTFNHFARTSGALTIDVGIAALRAGAGRRVDVAELKLDDGAEGGEKTGSEADRRAMTVLNAASVGIYPDFIAEREKHEKRLGKPVAAVVAAVRVLAGADPIEVTVDGRRATVWSVAVSVGRNSSVSMVPMQRRRLDDGALDVRVLHARGRSPGIRGLVALAFGRKASAVLDRLPRLPETATIEAFTTDEIRVHVRGRDGDAAGFAHDGEVSTPENRAHDGGYSASIRIMPGALEVYSPGPSESRQRGLSHQA